MLREIFNFFILLCAFYLALATCRSAQQLPGFTCQSCQAMLACKCTVNAMKDRAGNGRKRLERNRGKERKQRFKK